MVREDWLSTDNLPEDFTEDEISNDVLKGSSAFTFDEEGQFKIKGKILALPLFGLYAQISPG